MIAVNTNLVTGLWKFATSSGMIFSPTTRPISMHTTAGMATTAP